MSTRLISPKIWTTYFGNLRNIPKEIVPVSITRYPPKGWSGLSYKKLSPTADLLRDMKSGLIPIEEYVYRYTQDTLGVLTQDGVIEDLVSLTSGAPEIALVCYEKPPQFCHRQIVAAWLGEPCLGELQIKK